MDVELELSECQQKLTTRPVTRLLTPIYMGTIKQKEPENIATRTHPHGLTTTCVGTIIPMEFDVGAS